MKLVTIKNKYIFKPDSKKAKEIAKYKPNEAHIYAVYKDKQTKETRLIQMTHLIEEKKKIGIQRGYLMMVQLPNVEFPSGVKNEYFFKDVDGNPIDLKKLKAKNINGKSKKPTYLRKKLSDQIIGFAKKRRG